MVKSTYCSCRGLVSSTLAYSYPYHQFRGIQLGTTRGHDAYTHMQASTHTHRIKTLCSISSAFTANPVLCWLTPILEALPSLCAFQRSKNRGQPASINLLEGHTPRLVILVPVITRLDRHTFLGEGFALAHGFRGLQSTMAGRETEQFSSRMTGAHR